MDLKNYMRFFVVLIVLVQGFWGYSQDFGLFKKEIFVSGTDSMPYRILLPKNFDASKKYSVLFFLHGSGERGNDNEKQLVHGAKVFLKEETRDKFPAIIVFPQCPSTSYWSNVDIRIENGKRQFHFQPGGEPTMAMRTVQKLVQHIISSYKAEKKQIYIAGLSMGGMGTFEIVRRNPKLFAAAFAICGGGDPSTAPRMKKTNWWIFHGEKDDVVSPEFSRKMANALKVAKAEVRSTFYPNANHNSWDPAFNEPGLLNWLFSIKK